MSKQKFNQQYSPEPDNQTQKKGFTSIIIPVHNQINYTKLCLESLFKYTPKDIYELIVIDNASTDKTPGFLAGTTAKIIRLDENKGVSPGWNLGIKESIGEFLAFIHNDIILTPKWLENMLESFSNSDIWCVSPKVSSRHLPASFLSLATAISKTSGMYVKGNIERSCFITRRSVIEKVGLFDEKYKMHYYENDDFQYRIMKAGHQPVQLMNVAVHHFESRTALSIPGFIEKYISKNWTYFHKKWNLPLSPSPAEYPEFENHLAKLKSVRAIKKIHETKDRKTLKKKRGPAHVVACINVYNEVELLPDCINSLSSADEICIVDGAYKDFPHEKPWSTDGTIELIKSLQKTDSRIKLITCSKPWEDQIEKRNAYFKGKEGDWYLIIDADEQIVGNSPEGNPLSELKTYLQNCELDCFSLQIKGPFKQTSVQEYARIFRHLPGIRYETCHYNVVSNGDRYFWSEIEEGDSLLLYSGFYILHTDYLRSPIRQKDVRTYYKMKNVKEIKALGKLIVKYFNKPEKSKAFRTYKKMYLHLISQIQPEEAAKIAIDSKYL